MKKAWLCIWAAVVCLSCGERGISIDRAMEDGVEVVLNHFEPYPIPGEPSILRLERELVIDTEDEAVYNTGLVDMGGIAVDGAGGIYVIRWESDGDHIFKFDPEGRFLNSFCRHGVGPGELEWGGTLRLLDADRLIAKDPSKPKYHVFDLEGEFLRDQRLERNYGLSPLSNGNFALTWFEQGPEIVHHFGVCDPRFQNIRELHSIRSPNIIPTQGSEVVVNRTRVLFEASRARIHIADRGADYLIRVYDAEGQPVRMIRKEYHPVRVSEAYKSAFLERLRPSVRERFKFVFNETWPPYQYLFTDDAGRLFVMTYEQGGEPRERRYDIYNPEGIFIGRTSLANTGAQRDALAVVARQGRIYCLEEKESGYRMLAVYKTVWE